MKKTRLIGRLLKYLMAHKFWMLLAIVTTISGNLLALIGPYYSGLAIDEIVGKGDVNFPLVLKYCGFMAISYVASALLAYALQRVMIKVSRSVVFTMREDVFNKLSKLPVSYFDTNQTGDILSRISYDIDTLNVSLTTDFVQLFASAVTVIGALVMMLKISPILVLVFVITVPLAVLLTRHITRSTRPLFRKRSAKLGELNGFVEEMIGGQKTLKAYNREKVTIDKFDLQNEETVEAYYQAEYHAIAGPSVNFVNNLSLSLITFFGAILFLNKGISIGDISSFVLY